MLNQDSIALLIGAVFVLVGLVGYLRSHWVDLSIPGKLLRAFAIIVGLALMVWALLAPRPVYGPLSIGTVLLWAGSTEALPEGWLLCNGQKVSRSGYPELHRVIGSVYGNAGDGAEFVLPDLTQRFPLGAAGSMPGKPGGSATLPPLPAHVHPLAGLTGPIANGGEASRAPYYTRDDNQGWSNGVHLRVDGGSSTQEGQHRHELQGDTGASDATSLPLQNYLPPYLELHFIIKAR